ncbi:MAG: hypothetical protein ACI4VX_03080 [Succinivibrionaceae bacterium]
MTDNTRLTYSQIVSRYIAGDGEAPFLLACIDFMYYVQLMNGLAPLEDAQLVWQHARDLARYGAEQKKNTDASSFLSALDEMLEKKDQSSLTKAFDLVKTAVREHIAINEAVQSPYNPDLMQMFADHDKQCGINSEKYFLFRAIVGRGRTIRSKSRRFFTDAAVLVLTVLVIYAVSRFF